MDSMFVRVSSSERQNFLTYLVNTPMYRNKIAFVEGDDKLGIPNSIWTNGQVFAGVSNLNSSQGGVPSVDTEEFNTLCNNIYNKISGLIVQTVQSVTDTNNDNIPDWEQQSDSSSETSETDTITRDDIYEIFDKVDKD